MCMQNFEMETSHLYKLNSQLKAYGYSLLFNTDAVSLQFPTLHVQYMNYITN